MDMQTIVCATQQYRDTLDDSGIVPQRIDEHSRFADVSVNQLLQHARYLCDSVLDFAQHSDKTHKTNRHYAALQMCLSFAGWYTLGDIMNHSRPQ